MRPPSRRPILPAVTVVLCLVMSMAALVGPAAAAPAPTADPPTPQPFTRGEAKDLLTTLLDELTTKHPRPGADRTRADGRDLTLRLRDLRRALPVLGRSDRAKAQRLLARPYASPGCSGGFPPGGTYFRQGEWMVVSRSPHFCLHWQKSRTTAAWAHLTLQTLEHVWQRELGDLVLRWPPYDDDHRYDVFLGDLGGLGLYGFCAADSGAARTSSYCVLDDDYQGYPATHTPLETLRVTAAHEFFHAVQFGYDSAEDTWLMEGQAVWAEDYVYPGVDDYVQYVPWSAIPHPENPLDDAGTIGNNSRFYRYGSVLFWKFLTERFHRNGLIGDILWWAAPDGGGRYSLEAVRAALTSKHNTSLEWAFMQFGEWNTKPRDTYVDGRHYPNPSWWKVATLGPSKPSTGTLSTTLDHLTTASLRVNRSGSLPSTTRLRVEVNGPAAARQGRAMARLRLRDGTDRHYVVALNKAGNGYLNLAFDPGVVAYAVVTLTNANSAFSQCGSGARYSCGGVPAGDDLRFQVTASLTGIGEPRTAPSRRGLRDTLAALLGLG